MDRLPQTTETVFLGLDQGAPCFAAVLGAGDERPAYLQRPNWEAIALLSDSELALYGGARSLVDWHARHRFCARCGAARRHARRDTPGAGVSAKSLLQDFLSELADLLAGGKITPIIDKVFPLEEVTAAIRHLASGTARGRIVLAI